ncbi:MAG: hypothetical protein KF764_14585 [Labilithrix sp.]|nr:hypothetical protein [Labilithrix sp.]MBX3223230.1 hypothetical protein [Labilithrix sp.]
MTKLERRETTRRPRATGALAIGALTLACAACAPRALVALPSIASSWVDPFAAKATSTDGVTVEARTAGWPGPALDLGESATPLFVRVTNGGRVPLGVSRAGFELVTGTARFRSVPPDAIAGARADLRRRELRTGTLEPGESQAGFVYFEPVLGDWGFVHLRASLVDASTEALLGSLDVPFSSGRLVRCTLDEADRRESPAPEDFLFRGCLPPAWAPPR